MGEIKSTLDIIMEKTKGMTMSDEEKRDLRQKELTDRIKGLIQKFLDGIITYEKLKEEIRPDPEGEKDVTLKAVTDALFPMLVPGEDNYPLLQVLRIFNEIDIKSIEKKIMESERKIEDEKSIYNHKLEKKIKEKGISGTAVIPNLNADKEWVQRAELIKKDFREKLEAFLHPD
ncbi:MAG: hypothetical protein JW882_16345 [Deltaproteobacteria bacterium]|nr:hypothetical protein [Deltaproteobacteria bacterium]